MEGKDEKKGNILKLCYQENNYTIRGDIKNMRPESESFMIQMTKTGLEIFKRQ